MLFERYVALRDAASQCHNVEINPASVAAGRAMVGPRATVHEGDIVAFLHCFCAALPPGRGIDLLYLDSFDLDPVYWFPAAAHNLKELLAAGRAVTPRTVVMVDDAPLAADLVVQDRGTQWVSVRDPTTGGKGRLVAEYAVAIGAKPAFSGYQVGWTGF